jgi:cell shape-determining protein MreC
MGWSPPRDLTSKQLFKWLMVISVVCLLLPSWLTDSLDHALSLLMGPLSRQSRQMSLAVTDQLHQSKKKQVTPQQYEQLLQQHQRAVNQIVNMEQELRQQQELNLQLSGLRQKFGLARPHLIAAHIVSSDSSNWSQRAILNQGSLQSIQKGQIVLSRTDGIEKQSINSDQVDAYQMCVVGRIQDVGLRTSQLQLITDGSFSLPVFIEPRWDRKETWRADGVLRGAGMGQVKVTLVRADFPVRVGDPVLACSDPKLLPVELLVGQISSCKLDEDNPVFWRVTVKPAADPHTLREVITIDTLWEQ